MLSDLLFEASIYVVIVLVIYGICHVVTRRMVRLAVKKSRHFHARRREEERLAAMEQAPPVEEADEQKLLLAPRCRALQRTRPEDLE